MTHSSWQLPDPKATPGSLTGGRTANTSPASPACTWQLPDPKATPGSLGGRQPISHGSSATNGPTPWPTFWVTLFFGLFGVIPAAIHSAEAKNRGKDTRPYWVTFGCTFVGSIVGWYLLLLLLFLV